MIETTRKADERSPKSELELPNPMPIRRNEFVFSALGAKSTAANANWVYISKA